MLCLSFRPKVSADRNYDTSGKGTGIESGTDKKEGALPTAENSERVSEVATGTSAGPTSE